MAWTGWHADMPVIVVGVVHGELTPDGKGSQEFTNLADARVTFPDLDPASNSKCFTWAMAGGNRDGREWIRFETWKAYDLYST